MEVNFGSNETQVNEIINAVDPEVESSLSNEVNDSVPVKKRSFKMFWPVLGLVLVILGGVGYKFVLPRIYQSSDINVIGEAANITEDNTLNLSLDLIDNNHKVRVGWNDAKKTQPDFKFFFLNIRKIDDTNPLLRQNMGANNQYDWSIPSTIANGTYVVRLQARVGDTSYFQEKRFTANNNVITLVGGQTGQGGQVPEVAVGVRYFGSFPSDNHKVRNGHEQLLSEPQWRDRLPYFSIERNASTIDIHEDDQRVIDQEIELAAKAGISYWALETTIKVADIKAHGYNYPLNLYMTSPNKNKLKFVLLIETDGLQNNDWEQNYLGKIKDYMSDPQYFKVKGTKPLLYMWRFNELVDAMGENQAKLRMSAFKSKLAEAIGKEPYLVMLDLGSTNVLPFASQYSVSATSSYLGGYESCSNGEPYTSLMASNRIKWNANKNSTLDYIPTVTVGFDVRPKMLDTELFDFGAQAKWCEQGTPNQIADNVAAAVQWVKDNPSVTSKTKVVLMGAWADQSESGWLVPTLGEGNARLNAISRVIGGEAMGVPTSPYAANPPAPHARGTLELEAPFSNANVVLRANQPIHFKGRAPMAARLTVKIQKGNQKSQLFFINGKGTLATRKFDVIMPALPAGEGYTLTVSSPDVSPITINNIKVQ